MYIPIPQILIQTYNTHPHAIKKRFLHDPPPKKKNLFFSIVPFTIILSQFTQGESSDWTNSDIE